MKLLQDTTQSIQASPLLTAAASQSREGLSNQSKQGFADSLRHQISLSVEPSGLSAKAGKQDSDRQSGVGQQSKSKRGTELPVREQKLPRNNQTKSDTAAESPQTNNAKRSKQSMAESASERGGQSDVADNIVEGTRQHDEHNDIVLQYPSVVDTLPAAVDVESGVVRNQFFIEQTSPDTFDNVAADDGLLPQLLNATGPSLINNEVIGYEAHLAQEDKSVTDTVSAQELDVSAVPPANGLATIAQPGSISPGLATANTKLQRASETSLDSAFLKPEQATAVMAFALNKSVDAVDGGRNLAVAITDQKVAIREELQSFTPPLLTNPPLLTTPAAATAAGIGLQQSGSRQNTGTAPASLPQWVQQQSSLHEIQTSAADASETFDVTLTSDYASEETPDAELAFTEKLLNQKPALPSSAQYASMLAQSGSSSTAYSDAPIANGLLSLLVSGQQSSNFSMETSSLTAPQLGVSGNLSSHNSSSSLAASLYTLDQRQQAAAEARLAHTQNTRGVDTSMAATSALKLPGLDAAFGQAGWADRLGRMMLLQSAQGSSSAQIRLDPPELGSLTVRIQLADQAAAVNFVSPHAMVRDALEQQSARLQEMFREQGLDLVDVTVSDQSTQSGNDEHRGSDGTGSRSSIQAVEDKQTSDVAVKKSESLIDFYA